MGNKEERYLRSKMGKPNPFRVPEGYFDNFAARMMESLPNDDGKAIEVKMPRRAHGMRVVLYAAACLCVAVLGAVVYWGKVAVPNAEANGNTVAVHTTVSSSDAYVDAVADYAMMDNTDIYAYLSAE
jgi:predicted anti-sigma-YlaC factor YlaD